MCDGLPRTVSHSRMADHQALVAGSSEIAPPGKRATARLLASGIAAARGGSLAASETKCLQPGSYFNGDFLEIPCSCRRHRCRRSAIRADVPAMRPDVRFSNRPFRVKRFQTIHHYSVDVAHGLVLLFGIGAKALPSWDSKTRRNNLWDGLAVSMTAGPSGHTISPHPSSREGHHSTAQWNSSFLLLD